MNTIYRQSLMTFLTILLCFSLFPLELASAQRGRRGGGGARRGGNFRSNGASPRVNRNVNLQNRGNFSRPQSIDRSPRQENRQINQQNRQTNLDQRQQNRQTNLDQRQQNRQTNLDQRQQNRQTNLENRQTNLDQRQQNRQDSIRENQQNRQNFIDDNYYGGRWYGGGWYGRGYYTPPGWGAWAATVGLATGLAIGATVNSPPPYYDTVYVGSTSYIYSDGVFMQPNNGSYVIIAPPTGAVVTYLPEGCTQTQVNNDIYYNCSNIYYQPFYQNGTTVYKVVQL